MLAQFTLVGVIVLVVTSAPILIDKIPAWKNWQSPYKPLIIVVLGQLGSFTLPAVLASIPADLGTMTLDKIIVGAFTAAGMFVVHEIDKLLIAHATEAKAKALIAQAQLKALG